MSEPLRIVRSGGHSLIVRQREDRFDLVASGGGNISAEEFEDIKAFVTGKPGADAFLAKVAKRMER